MVLRTPLLVFCILQFAFGCKDMFAPSEAAPEPVCPTTPVTCPAPPVAPPECNDAADCPGVDSECQWRACDGGSCIILLERGGAQTTDLVRGDCRVAVCDGNGSTDLIFVDDAFDDRNECTTDSCYDGERVHEPVRVGTQCVLRAGDMMKIGSCSADGLCVESAD